MNPGKFGGIRELGAPLTQQNSSISRVRKNGPVFAFNIKKQIGHGKSDTPFLPGRHGKSWHSGVRAVYGCMWGTAFFGVRQIGHGNGHAIFLAGMGNHGIWDARCPAACGHRIFRGEGIGHGKSDTPFSWQAWEIMPFWYPGGVRLGVGTAFFG